MKKTAIAAALACVLGAGQVSASSYDDLNAGIQLRNMGQWSEAVAEFDKALAAGDLLPSQQFVAHLDRGQAQLILKHYDLALADYSACLTLQPADAQALYRRAVVYIDVGKIDEAIADLDILIARRPMTISAYSLRAALNAKQGKPDKSLADSRKILELLPDADSQHDMLTGIDAWQAGRLDIADKNFSRLTSLEPGNLYPWLWLALTRIRLGRDVPKDSLPDFDTKKWPGPIADFFTGNIKQDAVFAAAGDGKDDASQGRISEADLYVGEWLLQHHDRTAARPLIKKAAGECPMGFVEWSPAQTEFAELPP
jgi:tetratricopeptide (TPR) repeat protein